METDTLKKLWRIWFARVFLFLRRRKLQKDKDFLPLERLGLKSLVV
jgi:hypothetical protein